MPQKLPRWLQITLAGQAAVQWGVLALLRSLPGDGTVFGMPLSLARLVILGLAGGLTILASLVWTLPENKSLLWGYSALQKLRQHPLSLVLPLLCVGFAIPFLLRTFWLGNTLAGIQFLLAATLLYLASPSAWATQGSRLLVIAPALVILLGLGLRLWLLFVDYVWIDEGFHLSAAASILEGKGIMPAMLRFPDNAPIAPWRGYAFGVYGLWAKVFGLGLTQARTLSYFIGLLALPLIYGIARLWYGHRTGLVTMSIAVLSILFLVSTNGRTDTLPMLAISLTLFVHEYALQKENMALHVVTGLLAVLALETHFINLMFFMTWGGVYAVDSVLLKTAW